MSGVSDTRNVKLGVCQAFFNGQDLGYTKGGVEVSVTTETHEVSVDQFGKAAINEMIMGRDCKVKLPLAETTLDNLIATMPGATLVGVGGAVAGGTITIATNPTNLETITVNGKTITFKTVAGAADEVTIGATAAATAAALAAKLNASADPLVSAAVYSAAAAIVSVLFGNFVVGGLTGVKGVLGNAFTLVTGTAGIKVTMSAATLTGGLDPTSKYVDVQTGVGTDLLTNAKELRLHPANKAADDLSDDFIIPLAATAGALTYAYKLDDERVFNVEFSGYPDPVTKRLFLVGGRA